MVLLISGPSDPTCGPTRAYSLFPSDSSEELSSVTSG